MSTTRLRGPNAQIGNAWDPVGNLVLQFRSEAATLSAPGMEWLARSIHIRKIRSRITLIDRRLHFFLTPDMNDRFGTAVELVAFSAFIAAILIVVITLLAFLSSQCSRGTPVLPAIFPCF
jgi:hypothetical protein